MSLMMMRRFPIPATVLLAALLLAIPVGAQQRQAPGLDEFYSYGDTYFLEVVTLPGAMPPKTRVIVNFRFTYDLLAFRKTVRPYQKGGLYEAPATLYVEAVGTDGVIGDRAIWQDTARVQDYAVTNSKRMFLPGTVELSLRPGVYTIKYAFDEGMPGTGFSETVGPIKVDDFHSRSPAIGTPLFLRDITGDTLAAATVDGNALFGRPIRAYVPLASAEAPKLLRYELWSVAKSKETPRVLRTGLGTLIPGTTLGSTMIGGDTFRYVLHRSVDSVRTTYSHAALLTIPTDDLSIDDYLLLLSYEAGNNSVTDSVRFSLKWEDMPVSLVRVDYAIKALYPIATDDTIDALLGVGRERYREALERFWGAKDPTPQTKYNEAMAEYYRRVDYAFFNFKTIGQGDGVFTDRGKIYMLFGPPTDIGRELQPEALPREVWTYGNVVGKKFVFLDESRVGDYRLVEYYDL